MKSLTSTHLIAPQVSSRRNKPVELPDIYAHEISLEPKLLELVRLRVAQMCDCQLCIDHHTENLRAQGESKARIAQVKSWWESSLYSDRERSALAVSEALGTNPPKPVSKDVVQNARTHFNDAELLQLTLTIFAVNDWNHLCTH